jgi:hypothetical protein
MMPLLVLFAATAVVNPLSAGIDARLTSGLVVDVDRIPEPLSVDGVLMNVQRATGAGVPELARRIEATWRREGGQVEMQQQGNWMVRSRLLGARSEVMQWRTDTDVPELLVSVLDVLAPVHPVPSPGLTLPAGCTWGRSVHGRGGSKPYLQRSARCLHSTQSLSSQLKRTLPAQGWKILVATDSGMQIGRPGAEGFVGFSYRPGDQATWLTWLRVGTTE